MSTVIQWIPRANLEPHPDNPRKNLGDLSELAASIRKQGLLQNLTVVPSPKHPGKYRIVIGHRRFSASGIAGLEELPCVVDETMTYPEQIAVMMSENVQRNDLTVVEKVGGVQMMMDLGMSVGEVSGNTGISETSVRRYAKLGKLDKQSMAQAEQRGATLMQLEEIVGIEYEDLRDEAMRAAGTDNYGIAMGRVRTRRNRDLRMPLILEKLDAFAKPVEQHDWNRHMSERHFMYNDADGVKQAAAFQPKEGVKYEYCVKDWYVELYAVRKKAPDEDAKKEKLRIAREKLNTRIAEEKAVAKAFREMRDSYMEVYLTEGMLKGRESAAMRFVLWAMTRPVYTASPTEGGQLDRRVTKHWMDKEKQSLTGTLKISDAEIREIPDRKLLAALVLAAYDRISESVACASMMNSIGRPKEDSEILREFYAHMEALGYTACDEEKQWLAGTHECFGEER